MYNRSKGSWLIVPMLTIISVIVFNGTSYDSGPGHSCRIPVKEHFQPGVQAVLRSHAIPIRSWYG